MRRLTHGTVFFLLCKAIVLNYSDYLVKVEKYAPGVVFQNLNYCKIMYLLNLCWKFDE
jgi:hypothetical protein